MPRRVRMVRMKAPGRLSRRARERRSVRLMAAALALAVVSAALIAWT